MGENPHGEPRSEVFSSKHTGEQLEQLSGVASQQPYTSYSPWISGAGLELLQTAAEAGKLGRSGISGKSAELAPLEEAGLLTSKGALTGRGRLVTSPWKAALASLRISAQFRDQTTAFQAWLGPEGCLVLAGPSYDQFLTRTPRAGFHQLDFLALGQLYPAMAAWTGIAPAWSLAAEPLTLDLEVVQRRLTSESVPVPAGADAPLAHMWRQPWFMWQLVLEPSSGPPLTYVNAGEAGHYHLGRDDSGAHLNARPSTMLYRDIATAIDRAVHR